MPGVGSITKRKYLSKSSGWNNTSRTTIFKVSLVVLLFVGVLFNTTGPSSALNTWMPGVLVGLKMHSNIDYHVDQASMSLPTISPSGSYFLDNNIETN